jgi:hypothetical protein
MSKQIFKNPIPIDMLFSLLDTICIKEENKYIFNNNSYKKGIFENSIPPFIDSCRPYYHNSKHKYLDKKLTYNSFTTILRQICKCNNVKYTSQIKYEKSKYDIVYYVEFTTI